MDQISFGRNVPWGRSPSQPGFFRDPFEEIFFGERTKVFARSMDVEQNNPICRDCELRFLCAGGCHANTLHATGDHHGVDTFCSYQKRIIYDTLFASSSPQG